QFEQLYSDADESARVMALVVHPYIMGSPPLPPRSNDWLLGETPGHDVCDCGRCIQRPGIITQHCTEHLGGGRATCSPGEGVGCSLRPSTTRRRRMRWRRRTRTTLEPWQVC